LAVLGKKPQAQIVAALLKAFQANPQDAIFDQLAGLYDGMIFRAALKFSHRGEPLEDLLQIARLGFWEAAQGYRFGQAAFSTYATHLMEGRLKHYFRDCVSIIKIPGHVQEQLTVLYKEEQEFYVTHGRSPTEQELERRTGLSVPFLRECQGLRHTESLEDLQSRRASEDAPTLRVSTRKNNPYPAFWQRLCLEESLEKLKPVQRTVLRLFYEEGLSKTEIARKLKVSRPYITQVHAQALRRLRELEQPREPTPPAALCHAGRGGLKS
jgi:RNA polymerase sigma-B factor